MADSNTPDHTDRAQRHRALLSVIGTGVLLFLVGMFLLVYWVSTGVAWTQLCAIDHRDCDLDVAMLPVVFFALSVALAFLGNFVAVCLTGSQGWFSRHPQQARRAWLLPLISLAVVVVFFLFMRAWLAVFLGASYWEW